MHRSRRLLSLPLSALVVLFASVFLFGGVAHADPIPLKEGDTIIQQQSEEVTQKKTVLQQQAEEAQNLEAKKKALADQLQLEQQRIADLKQKIADKKAVEQKAAEEAAKAAEAVKIVQAPVGGTHYNCGDNYYAAYIYGMESGGHIVGNCDTYAPNSEGCIGIGQACPGSKLRNSCPNLDYACENVFFTDYANKYGGWAGAYQFWVEHHWW